MCSPDVSVECALTGRAVRLAPGGPLQDTRMWASSFCPASIPWTHTRTTYATLTLSAIAYATARHADALLPCSGPETKTAGARACPPFREAAVAVEPHHGLGTSTRYLHAVAQAEQLLRPMLSTPARPPLIPPPPGGSGTLA